MKRTAIQLADGRELIYFDERDDADRDRGRPARPAARRRRASQLRYDPLVDEWVAVAAHRQTRTFLPPTDECPLCPSTPELASEIPAPDYDVVVFENRFPSFSDRVEPDEITALTDLVAGPARRRAVRGGLLHHRPQQLVRRAAAVAGSAPCSTRWPTAPPSCPRCPASSRSSASRTAASRSA